MANRSSQTLNYIPIPLTPVGSQLTVRYVGIELVQILIVLTLGKGFINFLPFLIPYDALVCWLAIVVFMLICYGADGDKLDILRILKPKKDTRSSNCKKFNSNANLSELME